MAARLLHSYAWQVVILLVVYLAAMLFSWEFLLTVVMIALCIWATFRVDWSGVRPKFLVREGFAADGRRFFRRPEFWGAMVPFFLVLMTAPYSSDLEYLIERLRIKLAFLFLPFAFFRISNMTERHVAVVLYSFLVLLLVAAVPVVLNFWQNTEAVTAAIGRGQPMPTPSNHIRFSLSVALGVLAGVYLTGAKFSLKYAWEPKVIGLVSVLLFGFAHLLAVRSGLLVLYVGLAILAVGYTIRTRRWSVLLGFVGVAILLPVLAYHKVPSFQKKVQYAIWDVQQFQHGRGGDYSDSERLTSLQIGWEIFRENPWFGVGAGDVKQVVRERYALRFPKERYTARMPHNQFLRTLVGTGMVGLIIFLLAFFYPLVTGGRYRNLLFLAFYVAIFLSFWMENTFEGNYGISLYLLFLLLFLKYHQKNAI